MTDGKAKIYTIEVACITSDKKEMTLEVDINLVDKRANFNRFTLSPSWLDNFYRPEVEKAVRQFVSTISRHTLKNEPEIIQRQLQLIANEVCVNILMPQ